MTIVRNIKETPDFTGIDFVDENERQYFAEAQLGQQTQDFLRSPTGRLLHGRAKSVIDQAKETMLELDPDSGADWQRFKELQLDVQQARRFMRWCVEAIEYGRAAETQLDSYRSEI